MAKVNAQVAVVGAGMAGLVCAQRLAHYGFEISLFDKSGDIGGRLATRRRGNLHWNHGAPGIGATSDAFQHWLGQLNTSQPASRPMPGMNYVARSQMRELLRPVANLFSLNKLMTVEQILRTPAGLQLRSTRNPADTVFDAVAVAIPAPQARALLLGSGAEFETEAKALSHTTMCPIWTMLLAFDDATPELGSLIDSTDWPDSKIISALLPGTLSAADKPIKNTWVLHATQDWSLTHLEADADTARKLLWDCLCKQFTDRGYNLPQPRYAEVHRWRFAKTRSPLGQSHRWCPELGFGVAGDWCLGATAEEAYSSGLALANDIARTLS